MYPELLSEQQEKEEPLALLHTLQGHVPRQQLAPEAVLKLHTNVTAVKNSLSSGTLHTTKHLRLQYSSVVLFFSSMQKASDLSPTPPKTRCDGACLQS